MKDGGGLAWIMISHGSSRDEMEKFKIRFEVIFDWLSDGCCRVRK